MVRTVAGLRPVTVLWRRLDAAFADPLELDATSRLGTPGLVGAARQGSVTLVNALGSGVLETRALLAFMPRIARALLGEPLILPNIATWWCGQPAERAHVRAHRERMMIGPALSTRLPFEPDDATILGSRFRARRRRQLRGLARRRRPEPRRPGVGDALDDPGLRRRPPAAAADEPAGVPRPDASGLAGDAGRLRPHRPGAGAERDRHAARRHRRRRLGGEPAPRRDRHHAAGRGRAPIPACAPACCRAAPATTSTGSAATSSAPRAPCGWSAPTTCGSPRPPTPTRRSPTISPTTSTRSASTPRSRCRRRSPPCSTRRSSAPGASATASRSTAGRR